MKTLAWFFAITFALYGIIQLFGARYGEAFSTLVLAWRWKNPEIATGLLIN